MSKSEQVSVPRGKILDLYLSYVEGQQREYTEKSRDKIGDYRAGNAGIVLDDGRVTGDCPRKMLIRSRGLEIDPPTTEKRVLFDGGFANEEQWYKVFKRAWTEGPILREEEIPTEWKTSAGTKVTGRPDMVLCDAEKKPIHGLEFKSVGSLWTVRTVRFEKKPKLANVIQASHYLVQLGLPNYTLIYTSPSEFTVPNWAQKLFPKDSVGIEYNQKGDIKKILSFNIFYELRINPDTKNVEYQWSMLEGNLRTEGSWVPTVVSWDGIRRFYDEVDRVRIQEDLGLRPVTVDIQGEKENYSMCDYCPLKKTCETSEHDYQLWMHEVYSTLNVAKVGEK